MLSVVFEINELVLQSDECLAFVRMVTRDLHTILLSDGDDDERKLQACGVDSGSCTIENCGSIESFLERYKNKTDDWFLIVTNKPVNFRILGRQFVGCPYEFWGGMKEFETKSFTEHAKNKILYHELSWLYMESIANDTELEVDFLRQIFEKENVECVLDCCCGMGRHAARLGEAGLWVTGIDASREQIQTAMEQNQNDHVEYLVHDARNFLLPKKDYDAAICMWTTYNYFSMEKDISDFLSTISCHLRPGGILILDSKNIPAMAERRLYHRRTEREDLDMTLLVYKRVTGMIQNSQYFYFIDSGQDKKFYLDEEFVRFYTLAELQALNASRFELIHVYGDFQGGAFHEETSERMITAWKKCGIPE